jgi:hypothetical protein
VDLLDVTWDRERRNDGDHRDYDHQLEQGKTPGDISTHGWPPIGRLMLAPPVGRDPGLVLVRLLLGTAHLAVLVRPAGAT